MFRYYLLEKAYHLAGVESLQSNMMELNEAVVAYGSPDDDYYRSDDFWSVQVEKGRSIAQCIYSLPNQQFCRMVLPSLLKRLHVVPPIIDYTALCSTFPNDIPAFWGVVFNPKSDYELRNKQEQDFFRVEAAKKSVKASNLKEWGRILFRRIILCDSAYKNLKNYSSTEFSQIVERLIELDRYNQTWSVGSFAPANVTLGTNLKVSYESNTTNNNPKTSALRWFQVPNGDSKYFEPHIKMGNFRIHFYPDEKEHIIYVGYIGPHLPT